MKRMLGQILFVGFLSLFVIRSAYSEIKPFWTLSYELRSGTNIDWDISLSGDGSKIALVHVAYSGGKGSKILKVLNRKGKILWQKKYPLSNWIHVSLSATGKYLALQVSPEWKAYILDAETGEALWSGEQNFAHSLNFYSDSMLLESFNCPGEFDVCHIRAWQFHTGKMDRYKWSTEDMVSPKAMEQNRLYEVLSHSSRFETFIGREAIIHALAGLSGLGFAYLFEGESGKKISKLSTTSLVAPNNKFVVDVTTSKSANSTVASFGKIRILKVDGKKIKEINLSMEQEFAVSSIQISRDSDWFCVVASRIKSGGKSLWAFNSKGKQLWEHTNESLENKSLAEAKPVSATEIDYCFMGTGEGTLAIKRDGSLFPHKLPKFNKFSYDRSLAYTVHEASYMSYYIALYDLLSIHIDK